MFRYLLLASVLCAVTAPDILMAESDARLLRKANRYFAPLPESMPGAVKDTPARVALGKMLYFDKRLSINDGQSCASCHPLDGERAGMDNLPRSPGAEGELGARNTPTVLNAGWQFAQFWDGRADDLADQAGQPILNPVEMAMPSEAAVIEKLAKIDDYDEVFARAFPEADPSLSYNNLREAIAAFERTLRSESRFDDYLRGAEDALNAQEKRGLSTFIRSNCVRCHDGPLLGGTLYEKLGIHQPFPNTGDQGRYEVTGLEEDRMVFKVASLRNVMLTSPWFHDGSGLRIAEVVESMAEMQLDVSLKEQQIEDIVAFLGALSGKALDDLR